MTDGNVTRSCVIDPPYCCYINWPDVIVPIYFIHLLVHDVKEPCGHRVSPSLMLLGYVYYYNIYLLFMLILVLVT